MTTRYDKTTLLALAADIDTGFDHQILATMIYSLRRFTDDDIPEDTGSIDELTQFLAIWATKLRNDR